MIDVPTKDTWAAMEALVAKGKVRSIGVSNFTREKIEELLKTCVHGSLLHFLYIAMERLTEIYFPGRRYHPPSIRLKPTLISNKEGYWSGLKKK